MARTGARVLTEVVVGEVLPGGVAEREGLAAGDRLLAYDGAPVKSSSEFVRMVTDAAPGVHRLTIRRGGELQFIEVPAGKLGLRISQVPAETQQREVAPETASDGSPAENH
jgi:S1-C subfamily serine protease